MAETVFFDDSKKISSACIVMMFLIMSLSSVIGNVSAVGTNQNDIGTSGGDLPDNLSSPTSIPNLVFSNSISGTGELVSGTDEYDYLRVSLASGEGLAVELSFDSADDFDLVIYDSSQFTIDSSYSYNPETVSTNGSSSTGMIYIEIYSYSFGSMSNGSYDITIWKFNTGSTGGGNGSGGSSGIAIPSPCTGNGTVGQDILEPNDAQATATLASLLPVYCTGLSIGSTTSAGTSDEDFFEVSMISGVTYYFNLTFLDMNGDVDAQLEDSSGSSLTFNNFGYMTSSTDDESGEYTATTNFTAYFKVYLYSFGTVTTGNTYDIEISTDNPGGGQSFSTIDVTMNNLTNVTLEMTGLTVGDTYQYEFYQSFENGINSSITNQLTQGPYSFVATSTSESVNYTISVGDNEGYYSVSANLSDNLGARLSSDIDSIYKEMLIIDTTSSTTGEIYASNLTSGDLYTLQWFVIDVVIYVDEIAAGQTIEFAMNQSLVDEDYDNFTASSNSDFWQVGWQNPTTANQHAFVAILSIQGTITNFSVAEGYIAVHSEDFIPQLPSAVITNYSLSTTSTNNDFTSEGLDLVTGDNYYQQYRVEDSGGADIAFSSLTSYTATSQNMSFGKFFYTTPTVSGQYCLHSELYDSNNIQLIGDYVCILFVFDDDNDGIANEDDICPNTTPGSMVDSNGCALSQKDTDGDGYNDDVDDYPNDATQWVDGDGDGYGDNPNGNVPDAFPYDNTQWADQDGDGYGDNQAGNNADAFPADSTQWADQDGDGYGDNANGNTPDLCPNTPAGQVVDSTGCSDTELDDDSDGVPNSNDVCPSTPAGESVNSNGCSDTELDDDLDGIKDAYDACPSTSLGLTVDASGCSESQKDGDGDGLSDDIDQCPSTPAGSPVDGYGCSSEQRDNDNDGVYDNVDLCGLTEVGAAVDNDGCADAQKDDDGDSIKNNVDLCPGTEPISVIDVNGCSDSQLDDDQDQIFNNVDDCPATPVGEMPNSDGCSATQLDDDMDTINNAEDLCPMTEVNPSLDADGCVASQRDTDLDGVTDKDDDCPNTNSTSISDGDGCALEQLDSDGDGVNDLQDDFPLDALESKDTDGDGTPDRMDAYPGDATKTKAEVEDQGSGMWIWTAVAVLVLGLLAGLGMMKRNTQMVEKVSPFTQQVVQQGKEESQLLEEAPAERQEWEENGVKWSRSPEGTLYYYDAQSEQWIEYQQ